MARSPLTLAASVTSALPQAGVVGVRALTEGAAGRFDTAVADLDDGRRVVIRVPNDATAERELVAQSRALRALTPGVRALLPFRAPEPLGEATVDGMRASVVDLMDGYRVDAAELPPGRGAATGIGAAIAALHALPTSVVRVEGLPVQTSDQVRAEISRLLDRVAALHRIPVPLLRRWSHATAADRLWRFEATVVGGGIGAESFLIADVAGVPRVVGLFDWHGLAVGDPAVDLRWLASAPAAADDVFDAYAAAGVHAPDAALRTRARLYAELEFARWLVHGDDEQRDDIVDDAVALLEALSESVRDDDLLEDEGPDVDDALSLLERMPQPRAEVDTSMQTDAFDPADLGEYADTGRLGETRDVEPSIDPDATAPIDMSSWSGAPRSAERGSWDDAGDEHADEATRASDAALRRWAASE